MDTIGGVLLTMNVAESIALVCKPGAMAIALTVALAASVRGPL